MEGEGKITAIFVLIILGFFAWAFWMVSKNPITPNPNAYSDTIQVEKVFIKDTNDLTIIDESGGLKELYYRGGIKFVYDVPTNQNDYIVETSTTLDQGNPVVNAVVHLHSISETLPGVVPDYFYKGNNYGGQRLSDPDAP